jgi:hypothetical protein
LAELRLATIGGSLEGVWETGFKPDKRDALNLRDVRATSLCEAEQHEAECALRALQYVNLEPQTLYPTPYTLFPTPYALNHKP